MRGMISDAHKATLQAVVIWLILTVLSMAALIALFMVLTNMLSA